LFSKIGQTEEEIMIEILKVLAAVASLLVGVFVFYWFIKLLNKIDELFDLEDIFENIVIIALVIFCLYGGVSFFYNLLFG